MALKDDLPSLVEHYKNNNPTLEHNHALFQIYEGDLLTYVLADLRAQLSEKSYDQVKHRVAPINILKRIISKLSNLYSKPPKRVLLGGNDRDQELLEFYQDSFEINSSMGISNEFFNLFKNCALEPFLQNGVPKLRVVPSDRFLVYSDDPVNPLSVTHFIKIMGRKKRADKTVDVLYVYTDEEFLIIDSEGEIFTDLMVSMELDGLNSYGKIPFVYVNRSKHDLIPTIDTDTITMTKLIPVLLSDINFAVMFQSFSIIYGIDLDEENLKFAPNAFWRFKSDPSRPDSTPSIGVIKPEVDTDKVLNLLQAQISLWLHSRNIRPGAIGQLTADSAASGVAKIIDEMDTSEDRQKQIAYFVEAECRLWDLVFNSLHPVWFRDLEFEMKMKPTIGLKVVTKFPEQRPMVDESKMLDDQIKKIEKGLESPRGALKALNPDWTDSELDAKLVEISQFNLIEMDSLTSEATPFQ